MEVNKNGHFPHKCTCCDEDIGEDDNVLTCDLCDSCTSRLLASDCQLHLRVGKYSGSVSTVPR